MTKKEFVDFKLPYHAANKKWLKCSRTFVCALSIMGMIDLSVVDCVFADPILNSQWKVEGYYPKLKDYTNPIRQFIDILRSNITDTEFSDLNKILDDDVIAVSVYESFSSDASIKYRGMDKIQEIMAQSSEVLKKGIPVVRALTIQADFKRYTLDERNQRFADVIQENSGSNYLYRNRRFTFFIAVLSDILSQVIIGSGGRYEWKLESETSDISSIFFNQKINAMSPL